MKKIVLLLLIGSFLLPATTKAENWYDKIKLKGDFRHRHELIQDELSDSDRTRWRIRARLNIIGDISPSWSAHVRLATGGDDPVSTNVTMGDGFATKDFGLDRAYWDFHPQSVEDLNIYGGKMANPCYVIEKSQLMWDNDMSPAGAAAVYMPKLSGRVTLLLDAMFQYIQERKVADDTRMFGGQAGLKVETTESTHIAFGGGYFGYENIKGYSAIYAPEAFYGNTHVDRVLDSGDTIQVYANDFKLFEVFGEFGIEVDKSYFAVYGDYVNNTGADSLNAGYLFGGVYRYGKGKGSVKIFANYRKLEPDCVLGVFTDSDFIAGGTDGKGWKAGADYGITNGIDFGFALYFNKKGIEEQIDYKRIQIDLKFKF